MAGWGYYAFSNLTVEAFPDPTDTQVSVITLFPGQPTEEVERRVSIPLDRALNGTPGLFRLRSISLFGLSSVTLTFNEGVDPLVARQQVLERANRVVRQVAEAEKYDLILQEAVYVNPKNDITDKVIRSINNTK